MSEDKAFEIFNNIKENIGSEIILDRLIKKLPSSDFIYFIEELSEIYGD